MQARAEIYLSYCRHCAISAFRGRGRKIQKGIENQMNEFEKAAVSILKKPISSSGTNGLEAPF